jgi:hypothetical protein
MLNGGSFCISERKVVFRQLSKLFEENILNFISSHDLFMVQNKAVAVGWCNTVQTTSPRLQVSLPSFKSAFPSFMQCGGEQRKVNHVLLQNGDKQVPHDGRNVIEIARE